MVPVTTTKLLPASARKASVDSLSARFYGKEIPIFCGLHIDSQTSDLLSVIVFLPQNAVTSLKQSVSLHMHTILKSGNNSALRGENRRERATSLVVI
jgi:hypothetical protein